MVADDFPRIRAHILALYAASQYESALAMTQRARERFPEEDDRTTYWAACLLARLDRQDEALRALEDGSRRGLWWAPETLAEDPDFESVRDSDRFAAIAEMGRRRQAAALALPPADPLISGPSIGQPRATLVVLHGRGQRAEDVIEPWSASEDLLLVAPRSTNAFGPRTGCWDDVQRAEADVRHAGEETALAAGAPLVIAGFSQGAGLAVFLAARQRISGLVGCIGIAPTARWTRELLAEDHSQARGRFALYAGSLDPRAGDCQELTRYLRTNGADVRLDVVEGLGHDYPVDFNSRVLDALEWLLS